MPRTSRTISPTDTYHVMLRGINRQDIFLDSSDNSFFLKLLMDCKEECNCHIYAFCLMSNHVHLLIKTQDVPLATVMKRLAGGYASWFNKKYERVGHLFQDRFKSENVFSDAHLLTVLRYIIQNPMKAGLEKEPGTYPWSSFTAYSKGRGNLTDTKLPIKLAGGREEMLRFLKQHNQDKALEDQTSGKKHNDEKATQLFQSTTGCFSKQEFRNLPLGEQTAHIKALYQMGLTGAQLAILTDKSDSTIYRILRSSHVKVGDGS